MVAALHKEMNRVLCTNSAMKPFYIILITILSGNFLIKDCRTENISNNINKQNNLTGLNDILNINDYNVTVKLNESALSNENISVIPSGYALTANLKQVKEIEYCKTKKCIFKCCPNTQLVIDTYEPFCQKHDVGLINVPVYTFDKKLTSKLFQNEFNFLYNESILPQTYNAKDRFNYYLAENGSLWYEYPNAYSRWSLGQPTQYCLDYVLPNLTSYTGVKPEIGWYLIFEESEEIEQDPKITITGMYISCVFLALVLAVYAFLPELRNLHGMVLMAYVSSQFMAFLVLATLQLRSELYLNTALDCQILTTLSYFFLLASFFWMNIMSFDVWWTFRGFAKLRTIHRRGINFKFAMYCLYAFGVPFSLTILFLVLNFAQLKHYPAIVSPGITDRGCFIEGGERFLYLYLPMSIIIIVDCILFIMTAFNIWRLHRDTAILQSVDSRTHRSQQHRLNLYLKLFVVMGISWALEIISSFSPQLKIWKVTDSYNLLIGVLVFIIFICKRNIIRMIFKRFHQLRSRQTASQRKKGSLRSESNSSGAATNLSDTCGDTYCVEVEHNPKGYE